MLDKKLTRKNFLKTGFLGIVAFLILPLLKIFNTEDNVSRKNAKHYKNLAG